MNILFICRGNVGRSQMAEAIFNKKYKGVHSATSAGTLVRSKEGESRHGQKLKDLLPAAKEVLDVLSEIGIDASEYERTQLSPEMLEAADLAVVMAEPYSFPEYLTAASNVVYWEVEDPKGQDLEFTRRIRDEVAEKIESLNL